MLNPSQIIVANTVIHAITSGVSMCVLFNARNEAGKAFLQNTLLAAFRTVADKTQVALAVDSSEVAAAFQHHG